MDDTNIQLLSAWNVSHTWQIWLLFSAKEMWHMPCRLTSGWWYSRFWKASGIPTFRTRLIHQPGRYLGFTDILVLAKMADFISLRCWQNAVTFHTHPDNLHKKAQQTKSRELSCSNASRCIFINKQTRWTMKHASAVVAKTKASSLIRLIKNHSKYWNCCDLKKFSS